MLSLDFKPQPVQLQHLLCLQRGLGIPVCKCTSGKHPLAIAMPTPLHQILFTGAHSGPAVTLTLSHTHTLLQTIKYKMKQNKHHKTSPVIKATLVVLENPQRIISSSLFQRFLKFHQIQYLKASDWRHYSPGWS